MKEKSKVPIPQGKYKPANRCGQFIFSAGMTPRLEGKLIISGQIEPNKPVEDYREAAELAVANALVAVQSLLNPGEQLEKILTMTVYVNAPVGYTEHSKLADLASDYLCAQLGEAGVQSRTSVGVASLPGNAPLEIQLVAAVKS